MKIVADESVDKQIVDRLRASGHTVLSIAELDPGIKDETVLSRSREMGGAGLGLSIAQWIVQQHHGKIVVESTLGAGSIFRVLLPLAAENISQELLLK